MSEGWNELMAATYLNVQPESWVLEVDCMCIGIKS